MSNVFVSTDLDVLSNPMIDLSSLPPLWPNFSFLVSASSFPAISSILRFNSLVSCCLFDGNFQRIGNVSASNRTVIMMTEGFTFPNASKIRETGGCFPSRHPKLCENPAIPMLSSLLGRHLSNNVFETLASMAAGQGKTCADEPLTRHCSSWTHVRFWYVLNRI